MRLSHLTDRAAPASGDRSCRRASVSGTCAESRAMQRALRWASSVRPPAWCRSRSTSRRSRSSGCCSAVRLRAASDPRVRRQLALDADADQQRRDPHRGAPLAEAARRSWMTPSTRRRRSCSPCRPASMWLDYSRGAGRRCPGGRASSPTSMCGAGRRSSPRSSTRSRSRSRARACAWTCPSPTRRPAPGGRC